MICCSITTDDYVINLNKYFR